MKRVSSLVGSLGSSCRYKRFLACLGCSRKYFYLTVHYFNAFVPIAQQAGQAVVPGRLSLNMWLWDVERAGKVGRRKQKRRLFDIQRVREAVR
jgi:hypothetical protein